MLVDSLSLDAYSQSKLLPFQSSIPPSKQEQKASLVSSAFSADEFLSSIQTILSHCTSLNNSPSSKRHQLIQQLNFYLFYYSPKWIPFSIESTIQTYRRRLKSNLAASVPQNEPSLWRLELFNQLQWNVIYKKHFLDAIIRMIEQKIIRLCASDGEGEGENADRDSDSDNGSGDRGDNDREESENIEEGKEATSKSLFQQLQSWLQNNLSEVLHDVFPYSSREQSDYPQLLQISIEIFVSIRSKELFNMITDFPESLPSLLELKECVTYHASYLTIIGKELRNILNKRLLHLGASTSQILDFYVSMIKSLRLIDATDVLLNYVAIPIRHYLKSRKDTIRCILSSLTESKDSDLHDELKQGSSLAYGIIDEDDEENGPGESWQPSARYKELKNPATASPSSKGLDILATLVSIYGSTELFIVEYRSLLSEKMLSSLHYQTDIEVANLELLKIRFGEESLHNCEVMLKDIEDSKRTNTAVHSAIRGKHAATMTLNTAAANTVDHIVISDNYWPTLSADHLNYHPFIQRYLKEYHENYMILKKPRKLQLLESLGCCDLDLSFRDGSIRSFSVNPIQANVVLYIARIDEDTGETRKEEREPISFQDLLNDMELEENDIITAIKYWLSRGVIRECTGNTIIQEQSFDIIEEQAALALLDEEQRLQQQQQSMTQNSSFAQMIPVSSSVDYDSYSQIQSQDAQRQKMAVKLVEDYVKSLLKGHGTLSIDRLFTSLQLLLQAAMTENTNLTTKDFAFANQIISLKQFLQSMVEIDYLDGAYSLRQIR